MSTSDYLERRECVMSEINVMKTRGMRFVARCDFCGKSAEYVWLLFESNDGKNHVCNECVSAMRQVMSDELDAYAELRGDA